MMSTKLRILMATVKSSWLWIYQAVL